MGKKIRGTSIMAHPTLRINFYFPAPFAGREPLLSSSALRQRQEMRRGWERDDWKDVSGISKRRNMKGCKCRKSLNHLPVAPPIVKASIWGRWGATEARSTGDESPLARLGTWGGATGIAPLLKCIKKKKINRVHSRWTCAGGWFQGFVYTPWNLFCPVSAYSPSEDRPRSSHPTAPPAPIFSWARLLLIKTSRLCPIFSDGSNHKGKN